MSENHAATRVLALVPTWNAEQFVERTLVSLANQTYPNLRILISDDASTDDTVGVCKKFVEQDARFVLIQQPKNLGWLGNTNTLLQAAEADYLLFAFHDDVLLPDYISRCVAALEANKEAIVAYSDMVTFYLDGDCIIGRCTLIDGVKSRVERAKYMLWKPDHWWAPNRGVFRAEAADLIGGMKRTLAGEFSADWPWLVHMMLLGEAIRIPEVLVEKYYKEHSVSLSWKYSSRLQLAAVLACAREIHNARLKLRETLRLYATLLRISARLMRLITVKEKRVKH
ncbi:MAG: glycosyltransferase family 2 protein [Phycisphaeraceae bacterium]|nr:glycosyltransferase family 2 protein [Phycisphaeraceae bacterium]